MEEIFWFVVMIGCFVVGLPCLTIGLWGLWKLKRRRVRKRIGNFTKEIIDELGLDEVE